MPQAQADVVAELRSQVESLERQLGELHDGDVNALTRANASLAQHVKTLDVELQAVLELTQQLEDSSLAIVPGTAARQAGKTICHCFLGHLFTYWLRSTFRLSRPLCRVMFAGIAGCTLLPLGLKVTRKLVRASNRDTAVMPDFLRAIQALQSRVAVMCELTQNEPRSTTTLQADATRQASTGPGRSDASPSGSTPNGDDIVHVGPGDYAPEHPHLPIAEVRGSAPGGDAGTAEVVGESAAPGAPAEGSTSGATEAAVAAMRERGDSVDEPRLVEQADEPVRDSRQKRSSLSFLTFSRGSQVRASRVVNMTGHQADPCRSRVVDYICCSCVSLGGVQFELPILTIQRHMCWVHPRCVLLLWSHERVTCLYKLAFLAPQMKCAAI
eukprot:TRINITY_DN12793_c0_g1_i1.p1 TRINITY_DN12793_c0_g1~~TRINITY_DN12793_c0_g1_i1.p1  ORF type:complete len:384 (+),score=20.19 TRINITY_DN12793_c0_g1_i1:98-1249(+)